MVSAIVQSRGASLRALGFGLLIATALVPSGCARLLAFRTPNFPATGESLADRKPTRKSVTPARDLYAESIDRAKATSTRDAASRQVASATPESRAQEADGRIAARGGRNEPAVPAETAKGPSVALREPVTLPAFTTAEKPSSSARDREPEATQVAAVAPLATRPAETSATTPSRKPAIEAKAADLDRVLQTSRQALEALSSYQVRMNHQERVNGSLNPAEDVLLSIRRQPRAVRIEWTEGPNKGREVLYAADANDGKMHVRMGGAIALPRLSMSPDSPMARKNSRHPIYEAGFDTIVANMEDGLTKLKAHDPGAGTIQYAGVETPEAVGRPCHKITRVMPTGETWLVYLDQESNLPVFVQESAGSGELLERYVFTAPSLNVAELSQPQSFDPNARWGESKGLLSRLAKAAAAANEEAAKPR